MRKGGKTSKTKVNLDLPDFGQLDTNIKVEPTN
jgi:hypothetical protein